MADTGPVWAAEMAREVDQLDQAGLRRSTRALACPTGPEVVIEGQRRLLAASNDYLGLAADPRLAEAGRLAADRLGSGAGAARLVCGTFDLDHNLEAELATFKGAESALLFSTGYLANLGVVTALVGRGDAVFSDALNHASIVDGCRLSGAERFIYRHANADHLADLLTETQGRFRRRLIITDGVFSMDGDLAPLDRLADLATRHGAMLAVDDAHATGVIGPTGRGTAEHFGLTGRAERWLIQIGTLSKALGSLGGFAAGPVEVIEYLRNRSRPFFYTTALPPSILGAAARGLELSQSEPWRRQRVTDMAGRLRRALRDQGWDARQGITPIVPVVIGGSRDALDAAAEMDRAGLMIPAIRPPTVPENAARLRVSLTAAHTREHLETIINAFGRLKANPERSKAA